MSAPYAPKPLPLPGQDVLLPPPPPFAHDDRPPPTPTNASAHPDAKHVPARIDTDAGLNVPFAPHSATLSSPNPASEDRPKKVNPLTDLIDSERVYVDLLTGIIRKVAAAWSRSNLPPPELDVMFRSIEAIYRANRSLLGKIKDIGTNPKGLGDLLMRWIDDLETPYTTYANRYIAGFDEWEPVQSNPRLRTTLAIFSSSNPPPLPVSSPQHPSEPPLWTLDDLFLLPKGRLKYYKKLYGRLLKSTTPGRSDHRLLAGALEKLESLIATVDGRASIRVGADDVQSPQPAETADEVVIDLRSRDSTPPSKQVREEDHETPTQGHDDTPNMSSGGGRFSQDPMPPPQARMSHDTAPMSMTDLERRLSTDRTLDIFTMQPKQVRLQICPPSLTYTRELRLSARVGINIIPRSTGVEMNTEPGHVFILTDLLLICEKMRPEDQAAYGPGGPDMWLSYPPLAGKHLRVAPVSGSDTALLVTILRKETLTLYADSPQLRDRLLAEFKECIESGAMLLPPRHAAGPPPPVPSLTVPNGPPRAPSAPPPSGPERSMSPPDRSFSSASPYTRHSEDQNLTAAQRLERMVASDMSRMGLDPEPPYSAPMHQPNGPYPQQPNGPYPQQPNGPYPPQPNGPYPQQANGPYPQPGFPPRTSSAAGGIPMGPGQMPSFAPGQVIPPPRGTSIGANTGPSPGPQIQRGPSIMAAQQGQGHPGMRGLPQGPNSWQPQGPGNGPPRPPTGPDNGYPNNAGPQNGNPDGSYNQPNGFNNGPHPGPNNPPGFPRQTSGSGRAASRPPSDRSSYSSGGLRHSASSRSLTSQYEQGQHNAEAPPMPQYPGGLPPPRPGFLPRSDSSSSLGSFASSQLRAPQPTLLPSAQLSMGASTASFQDISPPGSPVEETAAPAGPVTSTVSAQMKCKVFLKQHHAQWKSLGAAKLRLYREDPTNVKQLVVEADNSKKSLLISTIVLSDGVERVGKTGVAVELSDKGQRTGIVYMLQLRNEKSAGGLFDSLLEGSDRSGEGR